MSAFIDTFNNILALNGMSATPEQTQLFEKLYISLTETNKLYNLTAVTDEAGVAGLHFCDSMMALPYIDEVIGAPFSSSKNPSYSHNPTKLCDIFPRSNNTYAKCSTSISAECSAEHLTEKNFAERGATTEAKRSLTSVSQAASEDETKLCDIFSRSRLLDIGCGAGFPCLPIAIMRPDISVLGVDSTSKKVDFSTNFATQNNLSQFLSTSARAEDLAKTDIRESFDFVTARAVARLNVLAELCLPFVKLGGYFLAMKGSQGKEELQECRAGIEKLGGKVEKIEEKELILPDGSQKRTFILIKKEQKTPNIYPRAYGKIKKCPLK